MLADLLAQLGPGLVVALVALLGWWAHVTQRRADAADVDRTAWGVREFDAQWDRRPPRPDRPDDGR